MTRIYYRTEVICELLNLPRVQLRRYERLGLIAPSRQPETDAAPGRYSEEELRRLRRILRLQRDLGLNLASLQVVMHLLDQIDALHSRMAELQRRVDEHDESGAPTGL